MDTSMTEIGFIGLGTMGGPIARHLVEAGHDVTAFDLRSSALADAEEVGARTASAAGAAVEEAAVVFLSLPGPTEVEAVVDEIGEVLPSDSILVDLTTSTPETTERMAEQLARRDVEVLGAPVSGGASGARAGTLSVMMGGDRAAYETCKPLVETFADEVFYLGASPGAGHAVKLLNNYLSFSGYLAACEAAVLGRHYGLDFDRMLEVFNASTGRNVATEDKLPNYVATDSEMGFRLELMEKDLRLLTSFADSCDAPLMLGSVVRQEVGFARSAFDNEADIARLYDFVEDVMVRDS